MKMVKLNIETSVSEEDWKYIKAVIAGSDWAEREGDGCSHGTLDLNKLAGMLLEDIALTVRRPGSWEGANMLTVLQAHGYDNTRFESDN